MTDHEDIFFLRQIELLTLSEHVKKHKRIKALIDLGTTRMLLRCAIQNKKPIAPFDILFGAKVLHAMANDKNSLEKIFSENIDEYDEIIYKKTNEIENTCFLQYDTLSEFINNICSVQIKAFVTLGVKKALLTSQTSNQEPIAPFDIRFFAETLYEIAEEIDVLRSIVLGDPDTYRWWLDD